MDGTQSDTAAEAAIVIRKYKNRRIYDTRRRRYITLDDLRRMIVQRTPFIVEDVETGDDVTDQTLLQIVVVEEQRSQPLLPVGFLGEVIRLHRNVSMATLRPYFDVSMNAFYQRHEFLTRW